MGADSSTTAPLDGAAVDTDRRDVDLEEDDPLAQAPARSDLDFAVVVGVEHYEHCKQLHGAHRDAEAFHDWLCDKDGGGLERHNAELILSDPGMQKPDQADIDALLLKLLRTACDRGGARRLYFYFAGPGATEQSLDHDVAFLL